MNQTLKKAYDALTARIKTLKDDLEKHVESFVSKLDTEKGVVKGDTDELIRLQKHMDTFFRRYTTPFLVFLAYQIRQVLLEAQRKFDGDYKDIEHIETALGIREGKIVKYVDGKMTVLFAIGAMKVIENDLVLMLNNSINGEVLRRDLMKNMMRVIGRKYHDFFQTYATATLVQSFNTAQYIYARKHGYDKFLYVGGLVDDSRDFCIERAGHEFTYEQGKEWDDMWWKGKIEGIPFFIQIGGYNCGHHLEWIKTKDDEN